MHRSSTVAVVIAMAGGLVGCADETAMVDIAGGPGSETAGTMTLEPSTARAATTVPAPTTTVSGAPGEPELDGPATDTPASAAPAQPVFDFSTVAALNGWSVVNDTVMGGVSTGQLAWENESLVFTGELSLDNNGGFASVRSPFVDPDAAARWAESTGLGIELRGDGRIWTVEVRVDGEDGGWISAITTSAGESVAVELPWDTFDPVTRFLDPREPSVPLDPARVVSVAFYLVDGAEAPFRLEVRSIW